MVSPNYTMELLYQTLYKLRTVHHFNGYIHVKAIPGADPLLIEKTGFLADRMSINLELPTADSLKKLAPCKSRNTILKPMRMVQNGITENKNEVALYRHDSPEVRTRRTEHTDDHRRNPGKRLPDCEHCRESVSEI